MVKDRFGAAYIWLRYSRLFQVDRFREAKLEKVLSLTKRLIAVFKCLVKGTIRH